MRTPTHLFNSTATVERGVTRRDSGGSPVVDWVAASPVRGRLVIESGTLDFRSAAERNSYVAIFYCGPASDIQEQDRLIVAGRTYYVLAIINPDLADVYKIVYLSESK